jgi:hypothetical protein
MENATALVVSMLALTAVDHNSNSVSWQKNSNSAICKGIYKSLKLSYLKKYIRNIYFSKYWYCFCCINISNSIAYICWSMDCSMVRSEGCPYPGSHPIHFIIKSWTSLCISLNNLILKIYISLYRLLNWNFSVMKHY